MASASAIFHGVEIPETLLATEMQNHQASSMGEARAMAGRALAARAALLARSGELGLEATPERNEDGQEETADEALIRTVLSEEISVDPPSEERLREIYEARPEAFMSPPLLQASHILIAPEDESESALLAAAERAKSLIDQLSQAPKGFERLAATVSACPSAAEGGSLGQLRPGDVLEEIWTALIGLDAGEICDEPVRSKYGWHVLRLDFRADGEQLPFDHVRPHIAAQLEARAWTLAAARYVDALLAKSAAEPRLKLSEDGGLAQEENIAAHADGMLGAALNDAAGALTSLPEDIREIVDAASGREGRPAADVLAGAIRNFLSTAKDEDWTQLISKLRESNTPLADSLGLIVAHELTPVRTTHTLIRMRDGTGAVS